MESFSELCAQLAPTCDADGQKYDARKSERDRRFSFVIRFFRLGLAWVDTLNLRWRIGLGDGRGLSLHVDLRWVGMDSRRMKSPSWDTRKP
jgi:hypothetical protein